MSVAVRRWSCSVGPHQYSDSHAGMARFDLPCHTCHLRGIGVAQAETMPSNAEATTITVGQSATPCERQFEDPLIASNACLIEHQMINVY